MPAWRATEIPRSSTSRKPIPIGWKGKYQIDGDAFVYIDRDTVRLTTIFGYPTRRLAQMG
jgi:hypothetical protein